MNHLFATIRDRSAQVAVIGLGYVGLPMAIAVAQAGFKTTGFDLSEEKLQKIQNGRSPLSERKDKDLSPLIQSGRLAITRDFSKLKEIDFILICVQTPLDDRKNPNLQFVLSAVDEIQKSLRRGQVIILESTTYPGTTEETILPLLEKTGLKVGSDFHLLYSPERIDPGNKIYHLRNLPKLVSGITPACTELGLAFYETLIEKVIPVRSPRVAEMARLVENTFRALNIGFANELAFVCQRLNLDVWEVIEAAATKPLGFMPFYPGPGIGGHCVPVAPHYLRWSAEQHGYSPRFIEWLEEIRSRRPRQVVEKLKEALFLNGKNLKGSKILVLGVAYKGDIADYRYSPALEVMRHLENEGADFDYLDPWVPEIHWNGKRLTSLSSHHDLSGYEAGLLLAPHSNWDMKKILGELPLLIDTRNATQGYRGKPNQIAKI